MLLQHRLSRMTSHVSRDARGRQAIPVRLSGIRTLLEEDAHDLRVVSRTSDMQGRLPEGEVRGREVGVAAAECSGRLRGAHVRRHMERGADALEGLAGIASGGDGSGHCLRPIALGRNHQGGAAGIVYADAQVGTLLRCPRQQRGSAFPCSYKGHVLKTPRLGLLAEGRHERTNSRPSFAAGLSTSLSDAQLLQRSHN